MQVELYDASVAAGGQIVREGAAVSEGQTGRLLFASDGNGNEIRLKPDDFVAVSMEEPKLRGVMKLPASGRRLLPSATGRSGNWCMGLMPLRTSFRSLGLCLMNPSKLLRWLLTFPCHAANSRNAFATAAPTIAMMGGWPTQSGIGTLRTLGWCCRSFPPAFRAVIDALHMEDR